jgi:hypothetical protein
MGPKGREDFGPDSADLLAVLNPLGRFLRTFTLFIWGRKVSTAGEVDV